MKRKRELQRTKAKREQFSYGLWSVSAGKAVRELLDKEKAWESVVVRENRRGRQKAGTITQLSSFLKQTIVVS